MLRLIAVLLALSLGLATAVGPSYACDGRGGTVCKPMH